MKGSRDADISFPAVEAVSLFFIIPQLCEKSKRFNSWCIYFLGLSSYVVKALNEVRSQNTISKTSISQKSHCLVAYSATWGLLGYSDGASSKLNPFIDIGLVMIFFTDIYIEVIDQRWLAYCCRQSAASNDTLLKILVRVSKGCNSVLKSFLTEEGLIILLVLCPFNINNFFHVPFFKIPTFLYQLFVNQQLFYRFVIFF